MGGGGPTWISSTPAVAGGSKIWIVIQPVSFTTVWGVTSSSVQFRVYNQTARPVSTDTPLVNDSCSSALFASIRLFSYLAANSFIDNLKVEFVPLDLIDATAFPKKIPVSQQGWAGVAGLGFFCEDQGANAPVVSTGNAYLGTDLVYTSKEDS